MRGGCSQEAGGKNKAGIEVEILRLRVIPAKVAPTR